MILRQLQHHRSRVPAIPPSVNDRTFRFTLNERETMLFGGNHGGQPWSDFMRLLGLNPECPYTTSYLNAAAAKGREKGFKICIDRLASNETLRITVTGRARISPKLLATFPWKLRRLQPRL